jgi:6-phosphogluconolactonase/glucosamine-6-phosphate isomerase/deaminase
MTLKHIQSAQLVVLLVSSEAKEAKVMTGLRSIDAMNPISYLLASDDPIIVEWPDRTLTTIQRGAIHES